jgi:hypothetical protein
MSADELIAKLQTLTPEQRKLPVMAEFSYNIEGSDVCVEEYFKGIFIYSERIELLTFLIPGSI